MFFNGYRQPGRRDFTEAGLELAEALGHRSWLPNMAEATLIQQPKLMRLPFHGLSASPGQRTINETTFASRPVVLHEGSATKTNKLCVLTFKLSGAGPEQSHEVPR